MEDNGQMHTFFFWVGWGTRTDSFSDLFFSGTAVGSPAVGTKAVAGTFAGTTVTASELELPSPASRDSASARSRSISASDRPCVSAAMVPDKATRTSGGKTGGFASTESLRRRKMRSKRAGAEKLFPSIQIEVGSGPAEWASAPRRRRIIDAPPSFRGKIPSFHWANWRHRASGCGQLPVVAGRARPGKMKKPTNPRSCSWAAKHECARMRHSLLSAHTLMPNFPQLADRLHKSSLGPSPEL